MPDEFHTQPDASPIHKLFVIELKQAEKAANGNFRPMACLKISESLRTSGLLQSLAPEELKSLLFMLTFVTPNGDCRAMLPQLAAAMHLPAGKARARLRRLLDVRWQGNPVVIEVPAASGPTAYAPHPCLVAYEHTAEPNLKTASPAIVPPLQAAGREAVVAYSRQRYSRPRAEVERQMAEQNGWELPVELEVPVELDAPDAENMPGTRSDPRVSDAGPVSAPISAASPLQVAGRALRRTLENNGLTSEQAARLAATYDADRIERQLAWLPHRNAKNPAAYLITAIEQDYEPPRALRQELARSDSPEHPVTGQAGTEQPHDDESIIPN